MKINSPSVGFSRPTTNEREVAQCSAQIPGRCRKRGQLISILLAWLCFTLSAKAQPTNDQSLTLLTPKGSLTNAQAVNFGATICVPIVVKFDTNVMVLTTQPQHQRPPEVEKTTYVKVFTVRRNVFADWTWVDSDGKTNAEMKLLESKVVKESHRSFRITTKEEYLEESSPTP